MRIASRLLAAGLLASTAAVAQQNGASDAVPRQTLDGLRAAFRDPPASARPRVWWHWMNGNVTEEGIRLDLEWMKRTGIGGFQNFDASFGTPQVVERRLAYMTPEWKRAFRFAMSEADRLGLEAAIAGSPGWSESGGPWVRPDQAMKKLVWSETEVEGGRRLRRRLAEPPHTTGPFQDLPEPRVTFKPGESVPSHYADSAVVAYRVSEAERGRTAGVPVVTASAGRPDASLLGDGDLVRTTLLPKPSEGGEAWVRFDYGAPRTMRAVTIAVRRPYNPQAQYQAVRETGQRIEASDDGVTYTKVADIPGSRVDHRTLSFPATKARYFRVVFRVLPKGPELLADYDGTPIPQPGGFAIAELAFHSAGRVNMLEEKADFASTTVDLSRFPTPGDSGDGAVSGDDVVDLTGRMASDGTIDWNAPKGRWRIVRLGYSLTGHKNSPASPEATGLEVDKLSRADVASYFNTYLDQYADAAGPLMGRRGLGYMVTDSWEAGFQNWTEDMLGEFQRRRGYSAIRFLPVLTGRVVDSAAASDAFLWDFRRTVADLVAANHYDQLTDILARRGMARYTESHEGGRAMPADGMDVKRTAAVPMSAIWTDNPGSIGGNEDNPDIRESASVAHIYGQNLVAAESFTAFRDPWGWSPEMLKPTADKALALGLNRFVIHTSVHQPLKDKAPGLALGTFGQWFTRNETWAEQARPWIDYLSRGSFLMQQGRAAADVLYLYGEDANVTALFSERSPDVPAGYGYDFVNADALINQVSTRGGVLVTPSGMRYRVIALGAATRAMSLPVLNQLRKLVVGGAVLVGAAPEVEAGRGDGAAFRRIVSELWGSGGTRRVGLGTVIDGGSIADGLAAAGLKPDVDDASGVLSAHRILDGADVYFLSNRSGRRLAIRPSFRVTGRPAEIWHPDTGTAEPAGFEDDGRRTRVDVDLAPGEAVFVVFGGDGPRSRAVARRSREELTRMDGPWKVAFQSGRGAPASTLLPNLSSWSEHSTPGIRYFSGTGTYTRRLKVPDAWRAGGRLILDLGDVKDLATVRVNGREVGTLWKAPFAIDVTDAIRPGENLLEIAVTDLWRNRLIGDRQPGARKVTFTTDAPYSPDAPLARSGLLGPVSLVRERR